MPFPAFLSSVERFLADSAGNQPTSGPGEEESLEKGAQHMRVTLVFILAGFVTIWLLCVGLIWHMRMNRAEALKGDARAARKVILPAYQPILFVLSAINGVYIVFLVVTLATGYFDVFVSPIILESLHDGNMFMFVIVLVLMFEKSLSFAAMKRVIGKSLVLAYYPMLYVWLVTKFGPPNLQKEFSIGLQFVHGLVILPFVYAFIKPPSRATKRIIREFCSVAIGFFLIVVVMMILVLNPKTSGASHTFMYVVLSYIAFSPLVVWRVLKADTEYWRGIGQRATALQNLFQCENGLSESISAEGLHVLIEMNRKCVIDFAYLELVRQIGVGSRATVFQGTLKGKTHVAVKAYAPTNCSEAVVAAFSREAAICSSLNHPNIVQFHGMCVAPPTICLIFQLCQGSLAEILNDQVCRQNHPARQQLAISIGYMLDAARAVAYLHSFSPAFVHRDINPSNFLVDAECNVQLSGFGESRSTVKRNGRALRPKMKVPELEAKYFTLNATVASPLGTTRTQLDSPCTHMEKNSAEYIAPELIDGLSEPFFYGEAADVYALAITLWDILHPNGDKYPQANDDYVQVHVFECVLQGLRPRINSNLPLKLCSIIERAWQQDPGLRPSAQQIVKSLEDFQDDLCARLVLDLISDFHDCSSGSSLRTTEDLHVRTYTGAFIVDRMIDRRFVRCPAEAIRLGNALMDSSVLHHANHSTSFENNSASRYYFDVDEAQLALPIDSHIERSVRSSSSLSMNESSIAMLNVGHNDAHPRSSFSVGRTRSEPPCRCRQLGQRLINRKSTHFHRQVQFLTALEPTVDGNTLTTALLGGDEASPQNSYNGLDMTPGIAATMA
ncbi:hypothetical protein DVH05_001189 [Phytophthora capsici]|nr:hypothetical protein DVH05_001189 [Phytophthora capsici]